MLGRGGCESNSPKAGMSLGLRRRKNAKARLDGVEKKQGQNGKNAKIARGQIMSSLVGHDQEFRFHLLVIRSHLST